MGTRSEEDLRVELENLRRRLEETERPAPDGRKLKAEGRDELLRYRLLYEENPSMYFIVCATGVVRSVNLFGAQQLGYQVEELVGQPVLGVFHEDDRDAVRGQLQHCVDNPGRPFDWEFRKRHRDGSVIWVREVARAVPDESGDTVVLIVCEDITHRKAVEQALRDSRETYRTLYTRTPVMLHSIDSDHRLMDVSDYWLDVLGYEREEVIGRKVTEFQTRESAQRAEKQGLPEFSRTGSRRDIPYQFIKKNGEVVDVLLSAIAEYDRNGKFVRSLTVLIDVTKRLKVEEALRRARDEMEQRVRERTSELERQRKFLRQVIDVTPDFIFAKDRDGRFTLVNQAVADAYGTSVDGLIGKRDADFNPNREEVEFFRRIDREVMDQLQVRVIPEEQITDSTGKVRWLQTIKSPLVGEDGVADQVLGSATDITARRQAEQQLRDSEAELRRSQRSLRNLAGRLLTAQEDERRRLAREMHDDVTQRLAVLAIQAGRLETMLDSVSDEATALVGEMRGGLQQLSEDVHDLSRQLHPAILEDLGLVDALAAECVTFSQREGVEVRFESADVPPELAADVSICLYRIAQEALRNVAKHAGTSQAKLSLVGRADHLELTVEDEGAGFETSRSQPGPGMGLSSMEERARLIEAELSVESRPGQGTRLSVRVPVDGEG